VARQGAVIQALENHANDLPAAVRNALDEVWVNQQNMADAIETLDFNVAVLLNAVAPDQFPAPGELEEKPDEHVEEPQAQPDTAESPQS
jgi:hypothetical protein